MKNMSFIQVKNPTNFIDFSGKSPSTKVGFGLSEVKDTDFHDFLTKTKVGFGLSEVKGTDFHEFLTKTKVGFGLSEVKEISTP